MNGLHLKYFVLSPNSNDDTRALASRAAILAYSMAIRPTMPELADDLANWIQRLDLIDDREGK